MVEFPPIEAEPGKKDVTPFDVIFTIIAVLASGFSGYTTYLGFSYDLPMIPSVIIAIIIGLGLLIINFKIREHRISGDGIAKPIIAFFIFFIFSFISNTNAIYTYFLQNDIVGETQTIAWNDFDRGTSTLLEAINSNSFTVERAEKEKQLKIARKNLLNQITDQANPGLGEKARQHLEDVEEILGEKITRLKPPSGSGAKYDVYAAKIDALITEIFDEKYSVQNTDIDAFEAKIIALREFHKNKITNKEFSSELTDLMKTELSSLGVEARKAISFEGSLPVIINTTDDIGSFQYTWKNFYDGSKLAAIILAILLSVMLDILTPVLSVLLYKREMEY